MATKKKKKAYLILDHLSEFLWKLLSVIALAIVIVYLSVVMTHFVYRLAQQPDDSLPYRFCLATDTSDNCVLRPDILIGNKISDSPDKLLGYFGSIPERLQQHWRVWIMDDEKSLTTELTVAEFYKWIESVWNMNDQQET